VVGQNEKTIKEKAGQKDGESIRANIALSLSSVDIDAPTDGHESKWWRRSQCQGKKTSKSPGKTLQLGLEKEEPMGEPKRNGKRQKR